MARKKKVDTQELETQYNDEEFSRDSLLQATISSVERRCNRSDRLVGCKDLTHVLPVPSLAFRYLIQSTGLPLGKFIHLAGEEATYKSTFSIEMGRWHRECGGYIIVVGTESKDTEHLRNGILGNDLTGLRVEGSRSLEEWQSKIIYYVQDLQKRMESKNGPGRSIPVAFIVDSLMAQTTENIKGKVLTQGYASKYFAEEAGSITRWLQSAAELFEGWPFTLIGVNHLKKGQTPTGMVEWRTPGGARLRFQSSIEFRVRKDTQRESFVYNDRLCFRENLRFQTSKNTYGANQKQLFVPLTLWYHTDNENEPPKLCCRFEWYEATTTLLYNCSNIDRVSAPLLKPLIQEVVNIHKTSGDSVLGGRYWCNELGVAKSDAMTAHDFGMMIEGQPELLAILYSVLNIAQRPLFAPGVDYLVQAQHYDNEPTLASDDIVVTESTENEQIS